MAVPGIISRAAQGAAGVFSRARDKWKALPKEQKTEVITTLGLAAASALTKPKKRGVVTAPSVGMGTVPQISAGSSPDYQQYARTPLSPVGQAQQSTGFASRMRRHFGRR